MLLKPGAVVWMLHFLLSLLVSRAAPTKHRSYEPYMPNVQVNVPFSSVKWKYSICPPGTTGSISSSHMWLAAVEKHHSVIINSFIGQICPGAFLLGWKWIDEVTKFMNHFIDTTYLWSLQSTGKRGTYSGWEVFLL